MTRPALELGELLPEIELIESEELRSKVAAVWQDVWQESRFESFGDVPVGLKVPYPHLPHNRAVVAMALAMADALERFHGLTVDRDVLLAAALVQDVSKTRRARSDRERVEQTQIGRSFQHAF